MLIGELAQKTGLSRDTIRFYEKVGLVTPFQRNPENGYKEYDNDAIDRLILITQAKALGFTLSEINQEIDCMAEWRAFPRRENSHHARQN